MSTQTQTVTARIRHMLISGEFSAGMKLKEHVLAETLEVSRTPVRLALSELEREGLLDYSPNRGFVARTFTTEHILNAVTVRERLESMAVGLVARQGLSDENLRILESCVLQGDGLLAKGALSERDIAIWSDVNGTFHETLVKAANNDVLIEFLDRIALIPLAGARRFTGMFLHPERQRETIMAAQVAHRWVFAAIMAGDASRAESVMSQHVCDGRKRLQQLLEEARADPSVAQDPRLRMIV